MSETTQSPRTQRDADQPLQTTTGSERRGRGCSTTTRPRGDSCGGPDTARRSRALDALDRTADDATTVTEVALRAAIRDGAGDEF